MLELLQPTLWPYWDLALPFVLDCWFFWTGEPKLLCYQGLFAMYLAGLFGARHHDLNAFGALFYLALYFA